MLTKPFLAILILIAMAHGHPPRPFDNRLSRPNFFLDEKEYNTISNDRSDLPKETLPTEPEPTTEELQALKDVYNDLFKPKDLAQQLNMTKKEFVNKVFEQCSEGALNPRDFAKGVHDILWKNYLRLIDDDNWKPSPNLPKSTGPIDCDAKLSPQDAVDAYINPPKCKCWTNYREAFTYRVLIHNTIGGNCCLYFADPMQDPTLDLDERVEKKLSKAFKSVEPEIASVIFLVKEMKDLVTYDTPRVADELLWFLTRKISVALGMDEERAEKLLQSSYTGEKWPMNYLENYLDHERMYYRGNPRFTIDDTFEK